jgi:hypothetical protein
MSSLHENCTKAISLSNYSPHTSRFNLTIGYKNCAPKVRICEIAKIEREAGKQWQGVDDT